MIPIAIIVPLVFLFCIPLSAAVVYFQTKYIKKKMGSREESLLNKIRLQFFGILFCAPLLIALNFFRDFDLLVRFAISGVGLLGFYIGLHDMLFSRIAGVYQKGVVWNGNYVFYSDIAKIDRLDPCVLEITLHDGRTKDYFSIDKSIVEKVFFRIEKALSVV